MKKPNRDRVRVSTSLDPETIERIDRLAEDGGKSRQQVMAEIIDAALPILEARRKNQREPPPG